jgi:hypothetical protein
MAYRTPEQLQALNTVLEQYRLTVQSVSDRALDADIRSLQNRKDSWAADMLKVAMAEHRRRQKA